MGLYRSGKIWWMAYTVDGKQLCESTGVGMTNKRLAQKILNIRLAEIAQGQFNLLKKHSPTLSDWSKKYLEFVQHAQYTQEVCLVEGQLGLVLRGRNSAVSHEHSGQEQR